MKVIRMLTIAATVVTVATGSLLLLTQAKVHAHGVFLDMRNRVPTLVLQAGSDDLAYGEDKLRSVHTFSQNGQVAQRVTPLFQPSMQNQQEGNAYFSTLSNIGAVQTFYQGWYWGKNAKGEWLIGDKQTLAEQSKDVGAFYKYSLSVTHGDFEVADLPARLWGNQPETALMLIPLLNPLSPTTPKQRGDVLPVQVWYQGKPLANYPVTPDYLNGFMKDEVMTNEQGIAFMPIRNQGLNVLQVRVTQRPSPDTQADYIQHLATFSFMLPWR
jgi:nickel transport protein